MCLGAMGSAIANTAAAKVDALTAVKATIGGIMVSVAAQDELVIAALAAANLPAATGAQYVQPSGSTAFYTQPANTTVYYVFGVIAAGTVLCVQGLFTPRAAQSAALDPMGLSGSGGIIGGSGYTVNGSSVIPDVPDGFTPLFVMKVVTGGAAYVPATTALTGIATFRDVGVLPVDSTF